MKYLLLILVVIGGVFSFTSCTSSDYQSSEEVTVFPGERIPNTFGTLVTFKGVDGRNLIFNDSWKIPCVPGSHHIGNNDYLVILQIDPEKRWIRAKIESMTSRGYAHAWTF